MVMPDPKKERSFIMIKPDGVQRGLVSDIIGRFERRGYKLVGLKMMHPTKELAQNHYADLSERSFYNTLCDFLSSSPVVAMVWEGQDIVVQGRAMIGATNPLKSAPGTIRGDYAIVTGKNIIHGSDSVESAQREIGMWFSEVSESVDSSDVARHEAIEQSPLHILPAPILILLALACLMLAACVAGLTLGLMSLDPLGLDIVMHSSNTAAAEAARKIRPVREQGNLLLVTLLFSNTLATELLPLVLEALVPGGYFSLVVSVVSIMLFGEIIPQAVCSRHPLIIGSYMIGFVKVLRVLMYPIAFPIAYVLDRFLGAELGTIYNKEELKGLIEVHRTNQVLTQDETSILKGALDFSQKTVDEICTPADKVFKLNIDSKLDRETMLKLLRTGHSRIPLYENHPNNIVCLLLVKQLILVDSSEECRIRTLMSKKFGNYKIRVAPALECTASILISDLLNEFQKGRSHMAIIYDDISKPVEEREFIGIVSIEDIIEEILQEEIIDETDRYADNSYARKVLIRDADGNLVRANTMTSRTVHTPRTNTALFIKEVDTPDIRERQFEGNATKSPIDGKTAPARNKSKFEINSPAQPLLGNPYATDTDSGVSQSDIEAGLRESAIVTNATSKASLASRLSTLPLDMQYAQIPSLSSSSVLLVEEDKNVMDDGATPPNVSAVLTSDAMGSGSVDIPLKKLTAAGSGLSESRSQLQLRPLPEDMSSEREKKLPTRQRKGSIRRSPDASMAHSTRSYGSTLSPTRADVNADEHAPALNDAKEA